jgi:2-hydroxy-3-keto-5-methylthiopentenyl-1-phosphate phosphatase
MSLVGFMTFLALYIMIVSSPSPVIVLDFDGTVTERDIGDEVCERFAPPAWRDIDAAWVRNEISLPAAQRQMWALARAERAEALAYATEVGQLRRGLDELLTTSAERGHEIWLASGGFDFYIEGILGARLERFGRVYCNRAHFSDGNIAVEFPHTAIACDRCAVCKGKVCDEARISAHADGNGGAKRDAKGVTKGHTNGHAQGNERAVVFIGDGSSDRCAIGRADRLFAVRGSILARTCDERGAAYTAFDSLEEVTAALG